MYSKFNLEVEQSFYNKELEKHLQMGISNYKKHEEQARKSLKEFIYDNGHIDGTSMKSHWFNMENVDVFISHSHQDLVEVKAFAGWLYDEFGLRSFIDSCVWGYCDDLLKEIDDLYCKMEEGETYDYDRRNYSTSHVHMMLSTALTEMIDNTECVIFYNTPNSVSLVDDLKSIREEKNVQGKKKVTLSPWIYHELAMTQLIRRGERKRTLPLLEGVIKHQAIYEKNEINIEQDIDRYLEEMVTINADDLNCWKKLYEILRHKRDGDNIPCICGFEGIHALDVLYQLRKIRKMK